MELIYTKSINNNKIPNNYKADAAAKIQEPIYTIINIINKRGRGGIQIIIIMLMPQPK